MYLPDDSAPQPAHQCPPLSEELSHSFSPGPAQRFHSRAQFISKRGETDATQVHDMIDTGHHHQ